MILTVSTGGLTMLVRFSEIHARRAESSVGSVGVLIQLILVRTATILFG